MIAVIFLDVEWSVTEDFHLSLSRTVAIPHHFIDPLVESLRSKFADLNKFTISFSSSDLRFYVNDEKTRSFLGFEVICPPKNDFHQLHLFLKNETVS